MQCVFGFAAAFGCRRPAKSRSVQFNFVYKNGWPLLPLQQAKNRTDAASKASREQRLEKRGQKDKKFTLLHIEMNMAGYGQAKILLKQTIFIV